MAACPPKPCSRTVVNRGNLCVCVCMSTLDLKPFRRTGDRQARLVKSNYGNDLFTRVIFNFKKKKKANNWLACYFSVPKFSTL